MLTCIVVDLVAKISWIELLKKKKKTGANAVSTNMMELLDHDYHLKYLPGLFLCFVLVYRPCIYPTLRWI